MSTEQRQAVLDIGRLIRRQIVDWPARGADDDAIVATVVWAGGEHDIKVDGPTDTANLLRRYADRIDSAVNLNRSRLAWRQQIIARHRCHSGLAGPSD